MSDTRRWARPLGFLSACVVTAGISVAAHAATASPLFPVPDSGTAPAPIAGTLANRGAVALRLQPGRVGVAPGPISLRYTFDGGVGAPITSTTGDHTLHALGQNGGTLSLVPQGRGTGLAVEYPRRCTLLREQNCPRAILEGDRDDALNPGTRKLAYGASVLMSRSDLSDGANVVQKGYSVGGVSQFKLQVDHLLGHPSCVITGNKAHIYRAEAQRDVADGKWHDLACRRTHRHLILSVDGVVQAWVRIPPKLNIANPEPLRVGGKGPANGNDQFAGVIDNVFLTIH